MLLSFFITGELTGLVKRVSGLPSPREAYCCVLGTAHVLRVGRIALMTMLTFYFSFF